MHMCDSIPITIAEQRWLQFLNIVIPHMVESILLHGSVASHVPPAPPWGGAKFLWILLSPPLGGCTFSDSALAPPPPADEHGVLVA